MPAEIALVIWALAHGYLSSGGLSRLVGPLSHIPGIILQAIDGAYDGAHKQTSTLIGWVRCF